MELNKAQELAEQAIYEYTSSTKWQEVKYMKWTTSEMQDVIAKALVKNLALSGVMQEFNSLIGRLVELLNIKYPNRQISNEFVDNLKTVWKGNELGLKDNIEALEKELNFA